MARQTYYVERDIKNPLYKTRMLTAGQALELDASAARLYRQLGVDLSGERPRTARAPDAPKAAPKRRATRKAAAKK